MRAGLLGALLVLGAAPAGADGEAPPPATGGVPETELRIAPAEAPEAELYIAPAEAPEDGRRRAMAGWYLGHRRGFAPVERAWLALHEALRPVRGAGPATPRTLVIATGRAGATQRGLQDLDRRRIGAACQALRREIGAYDRRALPAPPDALAAWHLRRSLTALRSAARVCDADRYFLLGHRLEQAGSAFLDFSRALRRYRLLP